MMNIFQLTMCLSLMTLACHKNASSVASSTQVEENQSFDLHTFLGDGSKVQPNANGTYYLCSIQQSSMTLFAVLTKTGKVIHEKRSVRGEVKWHNTYELAIEERPGVIEDKRSKPVKHTRIITLKKDF